MLGLALVSGALAFLTGLSALASLATVDGTPAHKLFEINTFVGVAIVFMALGGMLVYQATSSLGNTGSSPMHQSSRWRWAAPLLVGAFLVLVVLGQLQVNHPERLPWLFPLVNLGIVSIPSFVIATVVAQRYMRFNRFAWPVSWREWSTAIIYGAVGATSIAGVINTLYLAFGAAYLISQHGQGDAFDISQNLQTIPRGLGVAFDISVLSVVAPLNEEFFKGSLVGLFFYRKGGAARCFLWGVLAGAGFNVFETFGNSLGILDRQAVAETTIGDSWWLFAVGRAGTAALHSCATGFSALGIYGLLRHRPRYMLGYPAGVLLHGTWNFLNYVIAGDTILSESGPDSTLLDIGGLAGLAALFLLCVTLLWVMPRRLRDESPAPVYAALRMLPEGAPLDTTFWLSAPAPAIARPAAALPHRPPGW